MPTQAEPLSARTFRRDRIAWYGLFVLLLVVAGGWYLERNRTVVAPPDPARSDSTDPRILVLVYDRVSDRRAESTVPPGALRAQLEALRQEGFDPVTLRELMGFYHEGRPLPPKPLLLTFDFGYLDTYDAVDPILRAMGWRAVTFLVTSRQSRRDPAYLYWDRVQRMATSGVWEIGAQGHFSHDPIPLDEGSTGGSFLVDRMWLGTVGRHETLAEFTDRVRGDYIASKQVIEANVRGAQLLACASRIGFSGTTARDVFQANRDAISSVCSLGFVEDRFGVNDRFSDPHGLKRLRVDPNWSLGDILQRLRAALDDPPYGSSDNQRAPPAWVADAGEVRVENGDLVMIGSPRVDLWLPGSQWPLDWVVEVDLWSNGADVWLTQESDTPGMAWRLGGNDRAIYLQRSQWGRVTETVATFPRGITSGVWHHLRLVKRGAGVWVEWDGRPLRERPVYLPGMRRGIVGVVGWRSEGVARVRLRHLTFSRYPFEIRSVGANPSEHEVSALIRDAPSIAAISPLGGVISGNRVHVVRFDRELLAILSHRYGWEVIPRIRVLPGRVAAGSGPSDGLPRGPSVQWSATLLDYLEGKDWSGIRLDVSQLPPSARPELDDAMDQLDRRLRAQGRRFVPLAAGDNRRHAPPAHAYR